MTGVLRLSLEEGECVTPRPQVGVGLPSLAAPTLKLRMLASLLTGHVTLGKDLTSLCLSFHI